MVLEQLLKDEIIRQLQIFFLLAVGYFAVVLMRMIMLFQAEDLIFNHAKNYHFLLLTLFAIQAGSRRMGKTAITLATSSFTS